MKFLVGKNRVEAVQIVRMELLWEQVGKFRLLDLFREEGFAICDAKELRGANVTCVYLAPGFDQLDNARWQEFRHTFATRNIKTVRLCI